jgi:hypothetical protein
MFVSAKKKLLLTMDAEKDNRVALKDKDNKAVTEVEVPYRKFNFYMDNMVEFLKKEQSELDKEANHREIRLAQSTNSDGIQAFWKLFHTSHPRDVVVWLRTYLFEDINVPVMTKSFANGKDSMDSIVMQLHRHKDLGRTPLMAACEKVSLEIVEALLEQNANVKLTTSNGDTALHFLYKTLEQQQQKLEEESNRKTKVQQMNHSKIIFFKRQLQISHEILKLLLQKEPSVANATNLFGETPLHYCTRLSLLESCLLLLEQNANIDFKDRQGKSPIEYAKEKGHNEMIRILLNHQTINKIRQQEEYRRHCQQHFAIERGSLSTEWSSPSKFSLDI